MSRRPIAVRQHSPPPLCSASPSDSPTLTSATVYSYSASYDNVGNVIASNDSVNGTWSFTYDTLNRLATSAASQADDPYPNYCWQYDSFGNRLAQASSATAYGPASGGQNACAVTSGPSFVASYNANNQISDGLHGYDQAGNMTQDATTGNSYLYDGEGRICGVQQSVDGTIAMTQYLYDADGNRVAKGIITTWSCDTTVNGFTPQSAYVLDQNGGQLTEMSYTGVAWQWVHTNVMAPGLSATYDADPTGKTAGPLYFHLSDWLGTRRQQTDYAGNPVLNFTGLPFGDGLGTIPVSNTDAADATEHHFTGKERDTESGNDYFGARYYGSSMGRFLSPDWASNPTAVPYASYRNPQSLNLYSYMRNNPLSGADPDGHCCWEYQLASWLANGVATQGVGGFAGNLAVGALKGLGQAAYGAAAALNAGFSGNTAGSFVNSMMSQPAALAPSNPTQAQAAFTTSVLSSAAAGLGAGAAAGAVEGAEAAGTTTLFRAVDATEMGDLQLTGTWNSSLDINGAQGKGFFYSQDSALQFGAQQSATGGPSTSVVTSTAPTDMVNSSYQQTSATEGSAVFIENHNLPLVKPQVPPQ